MIKVRIPLIKRSLATGCRRCSVGYAYIVDLSCDWESGGCAALETAMFENVSKTYLDLAGARTRVQTSRVTQTLFVKDRLGGQLLLIAQQGMPTAVFPATDRNIEVVLCAGLRIHEYVMLDGEVDYREFGESRDYFDEGSDAFGADPAPVARYRYSGAGR
jgi:hypothetical protein